MVVLQLDMAENVFIQIPYSDNKVVSNSS